MSSKLPGLTPAELERLALLSEECAEVIQAVAKIQRHGYESAYPVGGPTNRERLEKELGDVRYAIHLMLCREDIDPIRISEWCEAKAQSVQEYLHHQRGLKKVLEKLVQP